MIFRLHLGIYFNNPNRIKVDDCTSDEFYNYFRTVSKTNTNAYDEVFKCIPSDHILTFNDLSNYGMNLSLSKTDPKFVLKFFDWLILNIAFYYFLKGKEKLEKEVNGFIVDFPL